MDIGENPENSNMGWTTLDISDNFSSVFFDNTSFNDTATEGSYSDSVTVYSFYSTNLLVAGAICCILLSFFGTAGNFISILALVRKKRLRNPTTAFIVNLCVADMLYCGFTMPLTAVTFLEGNWNYGVPLCKIFALVKFTNGIVSIFTVVAITVNRYVLIVHPKMYPSVYSKRNIVIYIFCLWIFPLTLICFPLFDAWGTLKYSPSVGDCGVMNLNGKSPRALIFAVIMVLPSVLFIACYARIYYVVKRAVGKSSRKVERNLRVAKESVSGEKKIASVYVYMRDKKEFRVLRIVLVIFVVYIVSIFPISLIKLFKKEGELHVMNIMAYLLYFTSSVINPVIYIIVSREYRIAYKELFLCKSN